MGSIRGNPLVDAAGNPISVGETYAWRDTQRSSHTIRLGKLLEVEFRRPSLYRAPQEMVHLESASRDGVWRRPAEVVLVVLPKGE